MRKLHNVSMGSQNNAGMVILTILIVGHPPPEKRRRWPELACQTTSLKKVCMKKQLETFKEEKIWPLALRILDS